MRRRLFAIMRKEVVHITRDWKSLLIILIMPILMIILYGYGITLDMRHIRYGVIDDARTPESRALAEEFAHNEFFRLEARDMDAAEMERLLLRRDVQMVLRIPADFSRRLADRPSTPVQIVIDASDSNVGTFIFNYASRVIAMFNARRNPGIPAPVDIEPRILYNPDMKSALFFVPALVAIILLLISALLTSLAITREKETGTLEQILVSPLRPFEMVVGKVIPYVALSFINGAMILLFAHIIFAVPVRGSLLLTAALSLVYVFTALSFGLMISTVAKTQQIAMFMTLLATLLPTFILSGFIFRIASMPWPLQYISKVIPATYFLVIIRGILLKGNGFAELWDRTLVLGVMGVLLIALAVRRFRTDLES